MRVIHINTHDTGGAANAAIRLHHGLLNEGVESYFITLGNKNNSIENKVVIHEYKRTTSKKIVDKLLFKTSQTHKNNISKHNLTGVFEAFTFPQSDYQLHKHPLIKNADIIHFHWIGNFVDIPTFLKQIKKPFIWTLHDMNPFQGGFHYLNDKIRTKTYQELENKLMQIKEEAYSFSKNMNIVTPSIWLGNEAKRSTLLKNFKHHYIPYGLNTDIFRLYDQESFRKQMHIPLNKTVFLFVSDSLNNYRKGFDILLAAIKTIPTDKIHLVCLGNGEELMDKNIQQIGLKSSENEIAKLFSAADVFILPSREDNLPNVMLESLCCGTPVISFNLGGMKDQIKDGENGYLADEINAESLLSKINLYLKNGVRKSRTQISSEAINLFKSKIQALRYKKLYESTLTKLHL